MWADTVDLYNMLFDLAREYVDATKDDEVVATAGNLPMGSLNQKIFDMDLKIGLIEMLVGPVLIGNFLMH